MELHLHFHNGDAVRALLPFLEHALEETIKAKQGMSAKEEEQVYNSLDHAISKLEALVVTP